ncbi:Tn3 family transposase [Pseudonocardia sp. ICBG1142]|uniref:Tn3 family transposase n=1 Tax=Pseudonocardia sp. ICBG1142 TaxID=2846760 RepID=UPI001CF666FF|nr:Tn3 family transposase [Pseudonocardia sp. ICBG1142]
MVAGTAAFARVISGVAAQLREVHTERDQLATEFEARLEAHPLGPVLTTMPGLGVRTAIKILTIVGDGSAFPTAAHLAAYAGLAPVTRRSASHPTYQAMLELGRAQKSLFVARYLRSRELQREINSGLNVVESWNRANSVIAYGKGGGLATNRRDEQEMIVACLRILQAALVYVNTLMLQDVLDDPAWTLTGDADRRGLSPLFWSHVLVYGQVHLDMTARLHLRT